MLRRNLQMTVSIRALTRRATLKAVFWIYPLFVSIRALTRRATREWDSMVGADVVSIRALTRRATQAPREQCSI